MRRFSLSLQRLRLLMRDTCLDMVYQLAKNDERIFFIGSDIGFGVLRQFKDEMPDRFFMEGISEANIIGMATGLALEGKIPYVHTIAAFLTRRCFEQIALDACLHNANVRLIGSGGGLLYAPLGPTHLAVEDIAILRTLPNMTILAPVGPDEMRRLMPLTVNHKGPIYIRLAKGYDPAIATDNKVFEIGKAILMRTGSDALIVTTGIMLKASLDATVTLEEQGLEAAILHLHTIKPLDREAILKYAAEVPIIVTIEEHALIGGLGSAVGVLIAEANFSPTKRFKRIGIPDAFADRYGSQDSLLAHYGITAETIVSVIKRLLED